MVVVLVQLPDVHVRQAVDDDHGDVTDGGEPLLADVEASGGTLVEERVPEGVVRVVVRRNAIGHAQVHRFHLDKHARVKLMSLSRRQRRRSKVQVILTMSLMP